MIFSDPSTISELLLITFLGATEQIKEAERKLRELQQDQKFLQNLMEIPKDTSNPYNIRKSAVLYTLTYCRARHSNLRQQNLMSWSKFLFSKLAENTLQINLRRHLINTIYYLLTLDKNGRVKSVFYQQCVLQCKQACQNLQNIDKIIFVGLAVQTALIVTIHNTQELCDFIRASFMYYVEISLQLFASAENLLGQNVSRDSLAGMLEIMKIYSSTLKLYLKKIAYSDLQTVKLLFEPKVCALISKLWEFDLKQNLIKTVVIFYGCNNDWPILEQHHSIKADLMQSLTMVSRSIFQYFKQPKTLASHELINKSFVIPILITSLESINYVCPHYKIKSSSLVKLIEQIMNHLLFSVKLNYFAETFHSKRKQLIENCLFKMLQFSSEDYSKMTSDPEQFINQLLQIIEMDPTEFLSNRKKEYDVIEEPEDVQSYTTLKTVAATLLYYSCKNIDGTTSEILAYAQKWLGSKDGSKFTNSLLILILGILRDIICERSEDSHNVIIFLTNMLEMSSIPRCLANLNTTTEPQRDEAMKYLLTLLTIQKYLNRVTDIPPTIISTLYPIISTIMVSNEVEESIKISAYEFVTVLVNRDNQFKYSLNFLQLTNDLVLTVTQSSGKVLDVIFNLIKFKGEEILSQSGLVAITLSNLTAVVEREVERADLGDKDIINKCWNIITDISQFQQFVQELYPDIENTILALSKYIDGKNHVEYQDHVFVALNGLINLKKQATPNLLQIFDIIPKLFYNKFECKFEQSFETINLFLQYGSNFLKNNTQGTKVLLEMAIVSMNSKVYKNVARSDSECCQGVLLLQNLIFYCGDIFTKEVWEPIVASLIMKLDSGSINTVILKANVIAAIALCLIVGYNSFASDTYSIMLTQIIRNKEVLWDKHSNKIVTIALCDVIAKHKKSSVTVFETLLDIIKATQSKEHKFQKAPLEDIEKQYENWLIYIKNPIIQLNQSTYFKHMINTFKNHDHQKWESILRQLAHQKVEFLKETLSTAKVNNETRQIFKIKR